MAPVYRDENGHFITEEEARDRGLIRDEQPMVVDEEPELDEGNYNEVEEPEVPHFGEQARVNVEQVFVDTGRGNAVPVPVGSPFVQTLERLAEEAHYGGYFRIFLNGGEVVNPEDSPQAIEGGQRIAITSYDKVGAA